MRAALDECRAAWTDAVRRGVAETDASCGAKLQAARAAHAFRRCRDVLYSAVRGRARALAFTHPRGCARARAFVRLRVRFAFRARMTRLRHACRTPSGCGACASTSSSTRRSSRSAGRRTRSPQLTLRRPRCRHVNPRNRRCRWPIKSRQRGWPVRTILPRPGTHGRRLPSPSLSERSIGLSELCVCPATAASAQRWR